MFIINGEKMIDMVSAVYVVTRFVRKNAEIKKPRVAARDLLLLAAELGEYSTEGLTVKHVCTGNYKSK